jgi:PAS domain S-box-containing protein
MIESEVRRSERMLADAQRVEMVRVQERLRESEERFQLIARATNDAIWDLDLVTKELWCSEGFHTLFGFATTSIGPGFWKTRIHPDDRRRFEESLDEALATGQESWSAEYRLRRIDGLYANVLDRAYIVRDADTKPLRMVGAVMDTTALKQMEDQLEQARRVSSLGRIAASMAHEFNNVLMGMQPNLEVIRARVPSDLDVPLDHVLQSVRRGKRVTEEILRFTRPADPSLQCVAVAQLMTGWRQEIEPVLGAKIELKIGDLPPDLYVDADPLQIVQVLTNVAVNARDAMQERGGVLEIDVEQAKSFGSFGFGIVKTPDRYVHFKLRDHGIGMRAEHLDHVFEPLFTTKKGGTGLGLAVSYQIVMLHGGLMFAESEPHEGSTFHILLPAAIPMIEDRADVSGRGTSTPRRVLIVEDEPSVAFGIQSLLEIDGIPATIVTRGGQAVPAIESDSPDLVILDIGLPDLDGLEVYAGIAARWPGMPILFSSGHADAGKLGEYTRKPNVGLLIKPYDFATLRAEVAKLME